MAIRFGLLLLFAACGSGLVVQLLPRSAPLRCAQPVASAGDEMGDFLKRMAGGARGMRPFKPEPAPPPPPPKSRYVPPEEWEDNATEEEIKYERRVQFEAMKGGNGAKQNEILQREINGGG